MNVIEALEFGRARIAKGHSVGAAARDAEGKECPPDSTQACSWCAIGALDTNYKSYHGAYNYLLVVLRDTSLVSHYSDSHTQAEVIQLYDKAIELTKADIAREAEVSK